MTKTYNKLILNEVCGLCVVAEGGRGLNFLIICPSSH